MNNFPPKVRSRVKLTSILKIHVSTNIIIFSLKVDKDEMIFIGKLKEKNILLISLGKGKLRMVTHRDYSQEQHNYVLTTLIKMNDYV